MTNQEIKALFTEGYDVTIPSSLPKWPLKNCFICIIIPIIGWLVLGLHVAKANKRKAEIKAALDKRENLRKTLPAAYKNRVEGAYTIDQLKEKALKKSGFDADQVSNQTPVCFKGYAWSNHNALTRYGTVVGDVASVVDFTYIFFTNDQVIIYTLTKDFYADKISEKTTEYFFTDITTVKASDAEVTKKVVGDKEEKSITYQAVTLVVPGDSYGMSVFDVTGDIEAAIKSRKDLIRRKKTGGQNSANYDA